MSRAWLLLCLSLGLSACGRTGLPIGSSATRDDSGTPAQSADAATDAATHEPAPDAGTQPPDAQVVDLDASAPDAGFEALAPLQVINDDEFSDVSYFDAAGNDAGDLLAVWIEPGNDTNDVMRARYYQPQSGWGEIFTAPTVGTTLQDASVALDANADGVVVWTELHSGTWWLRSSRINSGQGFGDAVVVSHSDASSSYAPRVVITPDGNATAAWTQTRGDRHHVYASRWLNTEAAWSTSAALDAENDLVAGHVAIAGNSSGQVLVAWQADYVPFNTASTGFVYSNQFDPGLGWGNSRSVHFGDTDESYGATVALNDSGKGFIGFFTKTSTGAEQFVQSIELGSEPPPADPIDIFNGSSTPHDVTIDDQGRGLCSSQLHDNERWFTAATRYTPGTGWTLTDAFTNTSTPYAVEARLVMNHDGAAFAYWITLPTEADAHSHVRIAHYSPTDGWDTPQIAPGTRDVHDIQLIIDANAGGQLLFIKQDGAYHDLVALSLP